MVGQYYQLSFHSKGISGFLGANPFQVRMIDGATVTPLFSGSDIVPALTSYTPYLSEPFPATSTAMTLEFADHALSTVQKVSWIDAVAIYAVPGVTANGAMIAGQFLLQFSGISNVGYSVVGSTDGSLSGLDWELLGAPTPLSNSVFQFVDPQASNYPQRFYRVRLP
jgi:hypothetical protein